MSCIYIFNRQSSTEKTSQHSKYVLKLNIAYWLIWEYIKWFWTWSMSQCLPWWLVNNTSSEFSNDCMIVMFGFLTRLVDFSTTCKSLALGCGIEPVNWCTKHEPCKCVQQEIYYLPLQYINCQVGRGRQYS